MDSEQTLDSRVRLEGVHLFVSWGRAPVPAEVAETLTTDQALVDDSLRRLAEAHELVLAPGVSTGATLTLDQQLGESRLGSALMFFRHM